METKGDSRLLKTIPDPGPFFGCNIFGEITGVIEIDLHQPELMRRREIGQAVKIAASVEIGKAEFALNCGNALGGQVFRSFFLAAGKSTLFNINL